MNYKLAFIGFGNVAKEVVHLLERKREMLKDKYDITYSITGISTGKHGFAVNADGLDMRKVLELIESRKSISALSTIQLQDSLGVIQHSQADVMFENTPVERTGGNFVRRRFAKNRIQPSITQCMPDSSKS